ncbi:hypothetical protein BJY16_006673 [Actinoplanes octamycinicus]|uniref:VCBS repeat-containing protein n=1 Tax=Actinoplanes octamycinicus TaxID=135948 RepID=A0A7W7H3C8_9ACTN|nr:hypothetical protein [Actinoplanes octamycinicus]MBB4743214.1 hypothetical protein [Actinoplanes octamycinicus]GIE61222.1 hypothetical protein Aoc01nite_66240 [Actinoplanes octamycinicus]
MESPRVLFAAVAIVAASLPLAMSPPAAQAAPDGHIPLSVLREATLEVPAWPADDVRGPSGTLRFHLGEVPIEPRTVAAGEPPFGDAVTILAVTYGDVDRDGADETIVVFGCLIEGGSKQIVAYDRDRTGQIVSLGQVAATTGEVRDIRQAGVRVDDSGAVSVPVADYQRCCADATPQTWQTRGYARRHDRFVQVSGPPRMPENPHITDTTLTSGELRLGPKKNGSRYGSVTVTISHRRGAHPEKVTLLFAPPAGLRRSGDWPRVTSEPDGFSVTVAAPPAGGSSTHTFAFRRPAAATGGELSIDLATVPELSPVIPWATTATAPITVG